MKPPNLPPISTGIPFTRKAFPKVALPFKSLTANLHPDLVEMIKLNPSEYLAIIPFGAGKKFNEENPMAGALFTEFIKTLGLDLGGLSIAKATPALPPRSDFDAPWIYILEGGSESLRNFLLWQQTLAATPKIAFSVVPFDLSLHSWVIANISGDIVSDDPKVICRALGVIKKKLWHDQDFRRITYQCLTAMGIQASSTACAFYTTLTFDIHYAPNLVKDAAAPMWILMGKPITTDTTLHQQYLRIIRNATYFVGMHKLEINKRWLDCVWCKSDTHPAHQCPLPQMDDWLGPKPNRDERLDIHPSSSKGSNNNRAYSNSDQHRGGYSRGSGHSRNRGRGRGRGNGSRGGNRERK